MLTIITGASTGIGLELALCAAREGHEVLLVARGLPALEDAARACLAAGAAQAHVLAVDVSSDAGVDAIVARVDELGIPVAALVNNAGVGGWGPFEALEVDRVAQMVDLNARMLVVLTHRLLPRIREADGGVLLVASTAAFQPGPGMSVYHATKAFVLWFGLALREELRGSGVRVSTLCPGPVNTGFNAAGNLPEFETMRLARVAGTRADRVAAAGWRGLQRNDAIVIPGTINRVTACLARIVPLAVSTRMARRALGALPASR